MKLTEKALILARDVDPTKPDWLYQVIKSAGHDLQSDYYGQGVRYPDKLYAWKSWAEVSGRWCKKAKRGRVFVKDGVMGLVDRVLPGGSFLGLQPLNGTIDYEEHEGATGFIDLEHLK